MSILDTNIKFLPSVGEKRAQLLSTELGITTWGDMLLMIPFRYIDRTKFYTIRELAQRPPSVDVQIKARVQQIQMIGEGFKARLMVSVYDGTSVAEMVWFRSTSWVLKSLDREREYIFFGRPTIFNGSVSMTHPEFEVSGITTGAAAAGVQGVYRVTEKLKSSMFGAKQVGALVRILWQKVAGQIPETLPEWLLSSVGLMGREQALRQTHFPDNERSLAAAIYRLKFEELFLIQLNLLQIKQVRTERSAGFVFSAVGDKFNKFYHDVLPFPLTGAQKRVVREVRADTATGHQMNRLLQGDVGSGKTIVALLCALLAIDNGYQTAIMAPTEILSQQHFESIGALCREIGVRVELLTGNTRKKQRMQILSDLADGLVDILIGTHALIEDPVRFARLGFVVIDEQHRFGVMQRARLHAKGEGEIPPHILVMTATPIPRTLSMTLYGDLDVSVIDELPPGRKQINTIHAREGQRLRVMGFIKEQIALGRQAYIVYPMIDESEKIDIASVEAGAAAIAEFFPPSKGYCSVVVHGKMPQKLKEYGMDIFRRGIAQILVATTVIEVGVNISNATVMVIENAERFGLSQLHQLRGRVGRGAEQSYCVLMTSDRLSAESRARIEAMVETSDGFRIAERDMQLRGAGDIDGTRQSGEAIDIHFADLAQDGEILERARELAITLLQRDPMLAQGENFELRAALLSMRNTETQAEIDLTKIS